MHNFNKKLRSKLQHTFDIISKHIHILKIHKNYKYSYYYKQVFLEKVAWVLGTLQFMKACRKFSKWHYSRGQLSIRTPLYDPGWVDWGKINLWYESHTMYKTILQPMQLCHIKGSLINHIVGKVLQVTLPVTFPFKGAKACKSVFKHVRTKNTQCSPSAFELP